MLNYIILALTNFFVFAVWSEGGFQMSKTFQKAAWLPRLADFAKEIKLFRGLTTHAGLILAVIAAVVVWYILYRSRWGYEIRLIGDNPKAAEYAGINIVRNTVLVMMTSGALAGLAGMSEIAGVVHRLQTSISPGYGFTGIIIAWLAKLNPLVVIFVSILFGGLILAGREIQPAGVPRLIQGIILFMLIASDVLMRYRVRIARNADAGAEE
jgi:simple sugar transport system permease protein